VQGTENHEVGQLCGLREGLPPLGHWIRKRD
jgi:hypothetical protein